MKSSLRALAAAAAVMLVCMLALVLLTGRTDDKERDTAMINEIVLTVRQSMDDSEALASASDRFGTELLVFGSDGGLIYASVGAPADIVTVSTAVHRGYLCMAITEGERFLGTAAIPDPLLTGTEALRRRLIISAAAVMTVLLLLLAGLAVYISKRIVRPFRNMRRFAEDIAQGKLDEPLMMEQGDMFGSFTESFDIMRDELREARRREDELKQREKELAASLGHDIKTPVTGIKMSCELMAVKTDDPYIRSKIEIIDQKAEQIHRLAEDLMISALDELGEMRVSCKDQPSSVLHTLVTENDPRGLVTEQPVPECMISVDVGRLSQVIANIISNSYKYAGTPIEVGYSFRDGYLSMEISDSGGGAPEPDMGLIMTKFYRGSNSEGKDGSGLGLYISNVLMKQMKGMLKCENRGGGLTVTLMIALS